MPQTHDIGGQENEGPIDQSQHDLSMWEKRTDAISVLLGKKRVYGGDEMRRAIEAIGPQEYRTVRYYDKWTIAIEQLLVEKGKLTREEIDQRMSEIEARQD
jgi:hypothetical protein